MGLEVYWAKVSKLCYDFKGHQSSRIIVVIFGEDFSKLVKYFGRAAAKFADRPKQGFKLVFG